NGAETSAQVRRRLDANASKQQDDFEDDYEKTQSRQDVEAVLSHLFSPSGSEHALKPHQGTARYRRPHPQTRGCGWDGARAWVIGKSPDADSCWDVVLCAKT